MKEATVTPIRSASGCQVIFSRPDADDRSTLCVYVATGALVPRPTSGISVWNTATAPF